MKFQQTPLLGHQQNTDRPPSRNNGMAGPFNRKSNRQTATIPSPVQFFEELAAVQENQVLANRLAAISRNDEDSDTQAVEAARRASPTSTQGLWPRNAAGGSVGRPSSATCSKRDGKIRPVTLDSANHDGTSSRSPRRDASGAPRVRGGRRRLRGGLSGRRRAGACSRGAGARIEAQAS